ncbi:MAG: MFS transporter [Candidatus Hydrogenedentes bacterium]|nr:MFS transporter [Candidatus Hydrogenedentota bacterium]
MAETKALSSDGSGHKPLSNYTLASYAAPAMPLALAGLPIAVYLPVIYADSAGFGLSLVVVGVLITLSRFADVITDPLIGFLSDRLRTRWGRRKPFVLMGTPIYALGMWLLFIAPDGFEDVTFLSWTFSSGYPWMVFAMSVLYLGSTIKDLPYSAWGAELSRNYNERTLIMSWREGFNVAGALVSAFIPAVILIFGYTKPTDAVFILVTGMCIIMPVLVANALIVVPEYPVVEHRTTRVGLIQGLKVVVKNRPYVFLVIIFAFSSIGSAMTNSLSFFFVKHVLVAGDLYGLYLAPYFVCQLAAIPLWFKLSQKIGKHRATMCAIGWYALWSSFIPLIAISPPEWFTAFEIPRLLAFLPTDTHRWLIEYFDGVETGKFLFFIIVMCLKGSAIGALSALPSAMAADVVDVDTATTGEQRAGAYFSIWSMVRKGAYALGVSIGLSLAVYFGFDSLADPRNTTNTAFALFMVACIYSVIPAVFQFIGMPLLWIYPLTAEKLKEVQEEIERKARNAIDSPEEIHE